LRVWIGVPVRHRRQSRASAQLIHFRAQFSQMYQLDICLWLVWRIQRIVGEGRSIGTNAPSSRCLLPGSIVGISLGPIILKVAGCIVRKVGVGSPVATVAVVDVARLAGAAALLLAAPAVPVLHVPPLVVVIPLRVRPVQSAPGIFSSTNHVRPRFRPGVRNSQTPYQVVLITAILLIIIDASGADYEPNNR